MTTKIPRINVTLDENAANLIYNLAAQEQKSASRIIRELAMEALELREDYQLSKIADGIDVQNSKRYSHEEVWK